MNRGTCLEEKELVQCFFHSDYCPKDTPKRCFGVSFGQWSELELKNTCLSCSYVLKTAKLLRCSANVQEMPFCLHSLRHTEFIPKFSASFWSRPMESTPGRSKERKMRYQTHFMRFADKQHSQKSDANKTTLEKWRRTHSNKDETKSSTGGSVHQPGRKHQATLMGVKYMYTIHYPQIPLLSLFVLQLLPSLSWKKRTTVTSPLLKEYYKL